MWSYNKLILNNKFVTVLLPDLGLNINKPNVPYLIIINLATEEVRVMLNGLLKYDLMNSRKISFYPEIFFLQSYPQFPVSNISELDTPSCGLEKRS